MKEVLFLNNCCVRYLPAPGIVRLIRWVGPEICYTDSGVEINVRGVPKCFCTF